MPIPLRGDFDAARLRAIAKGAKDAAQSAPSSGPGRRL